MPRRKASTLQWKQNLSERALKKQKANNIETQEDEYLEFESPEIEFLELDHASNVAPSLLLELDAASNDSYESEFSSMDEGETDSDLDEEELQDDAALLNFTEKLNSGMAKYSHTKHRHAANIRKNTETLRSQGYGDIQSYFTMKQGWPVQGDENMVPVVAELQRVQMREEAEEEEEEEEESDGDKIIPGLQSVPLLIEEEEEEIDLPADEEIDIWTSVHSSAVESNHNDTLNEQNKALYGINAIDPSLPIPSPSSQSLLLSTPSEDGNPPIIPIEIEYETAAEFETTEEDISEDLK
ncbi:hypothetical protein M422DRAFT_264442 [Sphaerobolus stellatus SS14]|uniref:Unplaced genomic scaffold SPHSTscaffold_136, whole genome shotgun sequence n=1 Tax=Sphaerobolus stellatus (strain SS14) TaxID=990650 RepID=A0A0C9V893_SPHS4|nr:hypothetical protein M422DRAFT_264442 [Sphaerobolus stellatus SS14]